MSKQKIENHQEWLEQHPLESEIITNEDGFDHIPVGIIENLLDELTEYQWETRNFKFSTYEINYNKFVSGSLELEVKFEGQMYRSLVGAATIDVSKLTDKDGNVNSDYEATILSLALCNAAKKLGNRFGRSLNGRLTKDNSLGKNKREALLIKPDVEIIKQYDAAVDAMDMETQSKLLSIYDLDEHNFKTYP